MGEVGLCTLSDIAQTVSTILVSDITTDTGIPIFVIRMLHNKLIYWVFYSARCYAQYFDTTRLLQYGPSVLLPFFYWAFLGKPYRRIFLIAALLIPLFFISNPMHLDLGAKIRLMKGVFIFFSLVGLTKVIRSLFMLKKQK